MNTTTTKTGVTATGFSRSSFGCCARHHLCEMGRKSCYYEDKDPEVLTLCAAYRRQHENKEVGTVEVEQPELSLLAITEECRESEQYQEQNDGQLSLF